MRTAHEQTRQEQHGITLPATGGSKIRSAFSTAFWLFHFYFLEKMSKKQRFFTFGNEETLFFAAFLLKQKSCKKLCFLLGKSFFVKTKKEKVLPKTKTPKS